MSGLVAVRDRAAAGLARAAGTVSRVVGAGGGSSLPGLVVERLSPGYVRRRTAGLPGGVVLVSGTNGKTTTASMLRLILRANGVVTAGNETGANLGRGVAAALLTAPPEARMGVFEVDEAALPAVVRDVSPRLLVLTNVFRDQLDRYGETETVARLLRRAAQAAPADAIVLANADDPLLWQSVGPQRPVGFGVGMPEQTNGTGDSPAGAAGEPETCPACGADVVHLTRTVAHLGRVRCDACGWASAEPEYPAVVTGSSGVRRMRLEVAGQPVEVALGGLHNAYNVAAAMGAADLLGVPLRRSADALGTFRPRFGRAEELTVDGEPVWLLLMKNPAGAGAVIDQVVTDPGIGSAVVAVSDQIADGRDISWIWDADFEALARWGRPLVPSGRRAADVAVRLKYAGAEPLPAEPAARAAVGVARAAAPANPGVAILATYTAMLDVRQALGAGRRDRLSDAAP